MKKVISVLLLTALIVSVTAGVASAYSFNFKVLDKPQVVTFDTVSYPPLSIVKDNTVRIVLDENTEPVKVNPIIQPIPIPQPLIVIDASDVYIVNRKVVPFTTNIIIDGSEPYKIERQMVIFNN